MNIKCNMCDKHGGLKPGRLNWRTAFGETGHVSFRQAQTRILRQRNLTHWPVFVVIQTNWLVNVTRSVPIEIICQSTCSETYPDDLSRP